ncbi:putative DNA modification/repair radical SAM protein [Flavobacterium turcicum]|uniref:DNA modification/repair radical SAM protein n=1 Tax=Flavobacterium turcicum TaxID=2764718 RepID=A0ABR7JE72_9FLAO|nr:putative DNA modification/repair radical SAM protein [Flavobacterium turcicum]MBC5862803.1 putative DNA modification/repair radical SAM protein [Flavobacterium turcicum]NHL01535.1 putative DNA modification/repair radical SAM protein [Flavobacterium turcicum]
MKQDRVLEKLEILADAAKYDVSCSSGQSNRENKNKVLGDSKGYGICHAFTEDGRCVSLLKILLTNYCIFDCAYCVSRKSNDVKRAAFTVDEVVELTINFYRRNYIEGLFLSSGIFDSPDATMERLVRIAKKLRTIHNFNGYIHLKAIPGASSDLMTQAGMYADRLSINLEIPSEKNLKILAPEKNHKDVITPMTFLKEQIDGHKEEKKINFKAPIFAPAGQSTQMVIGASNETDLEILGTADGFYKKMSLKRVYYSGYVPISHDARLPAIGTPVPIIRENRLYQADWLFRYYNFDVKELVNSTNPNLDLDIDPKLGWALRNLDQFPININYADLEIIKRIPGIGFLSAKKIVEARKFRKIRPEDLKTIGVAYSRAKYFMTFDNPISITKDYTPFELKQLILKNQNSKYKPNFSNQLSLF